MISTTLAWRIGRLVAVVLFLSGAGWYARSVLAERDQLRVDLADARAAITAQNESIERARHDAVKQAQTVDRLSADRDALALRAADLLRRARSMPIITEPAGSCAPATSTDASRGDAAGDCGLSAADRTRLESRLAQTRETTLDIAADADRVALRLTAAQAEIVRLREWISGECSR